MFKIIATGIMDVQKEILDSTDEKKWDEKIEEKLEKAEKYAQKIAPKLTGYLASTIFTKRIGKLKFKFGVKAWYAFFHEYGTYKLPIGTVADPLEYTNMAGGISYRPFIRPAIWKFLKEL